MRYSSHGNASKDKKRINIYQNGTEEIWKEPDGAKTEKSRF
jgi:hypothetical protein